MYPSVTLPPSKLPADPDPAGQANRGHRMPSQDAAPVAQALLEPWQSEREEKSVTMGGGEVARHVALPGQSRPRSVVFAAAVPPDLLKTADNPEGPLTPVKARQMREAHQEGRTVFLDRFATGYFSAGPRGGLRAHQGLGRSNAPPGLAVRHARTA